LEPELELRSTHGSSVRSKWSTGGGYIFYETSSRLGKSHYYLDTVLIYHVRGLQGLYYAYFYTRLGNSFQIQWEKYQKTSDPYQLFIFQLQLQQMTSARLECQETTWAVSRSKQSPRGRTDILSSSFNSTLGRSIKDSRASESIKGSHQWVRTYALNGELLLQLVSDVQC
jgi:hypothetical protein